MRILRFLALVLFFVFVSCTGIGVYQPPKILPKGEKSYGVGAPVAYLGQNGVVLLPLPEFYMRYGIGPNMDFSFRMPFALFGSSGAAFNLTGDIRFGTGSYPGAIFSLQSTTWFSTESKDVLFLVQPGVFFTTGKTMAGVQLIHLKTSFSPDSEPIFKALRLHYVYEEKWGKFQVFPAISFIVPLDKDVENIFGVIEVCIELRPGR